MAYVYSHIRKDNGKCFYIGKGEGKRAFSAQGRNNYWNNVVNKHGYDVKILVNNITEQKALELERDFISQIGLENLTNLQDGGKGGWSHLSYYDRTKGAKKAALTRKINGYKPSEETKLKTSNSMKGKNTEPMSEEAKLKLSKSRLGKKYPKLSEAKKGKPFSGKWYHAVGEKNGKYGTGNKYKELTTGIEGYLYDMKQAFDNIPITNIKNSISYNGPLKKGKYKGLTFKII